MEKSESIDYPKHITLAQSRLEKGRMDQIRHPFFSLNLFANYEPKGEPLQELLERSIYDSEAPSWFGDMKLIWPGHPEYRHRNENSFEKSGSAKTDSTGRTDGLANSGSPSSSSSVGHAAENADNDSAATSLSRNRRTSVETPAKCQASKDASLSGTDTTGLANGEGLTKPHELAEEPSAKRRKCEA